MRFSATYSVLLIIAVFVSVAIGQGDNFPVLQGPYLGYKPPGETPVKFPFDFLPEGYRLHSAPAFTPDGEEVYFSAMDFSVRFSEKIFVMRMSGGTWGLPEVAPFSGDFFDGSPSIAGDGSCLFFSSARTRDQKKRSETGKRNIWFVKRGGDGWSAPEPLGFQTPEWQNGSDLSDEGNLYFDSKDIYRLAFDESTQSDPVKLGKAINSEHTELHPCIAPDERFLIFYSSRPGHFGESGGDLYISFKNEDGDWRPAVNMGETFNKGHLSTSFPRLSPDGEYLFFLKLVSVPWKAEVYWVSTKALLAEEFYKQGEK
ncbi:MAG: PD40 domain-containing protein [Candidatus Zixiibacteriota bacterium]|nr:MAG: PD40 domain-containing protein [candidate division Zixibacteria bacterium]